MPRRHSPSHRRWRRPTLKWAHVYETSEPFHTAIGLGGGEIDKRTNGRYHIDVYPASQLGKETDINQGLYAGQRRHHHLGLELRRARAIPPIGVTYYPYTFRDADHLLAYTKSDIFKELAQGLRGQDRAPDRGGHLLRRSAHLVEPANQYLRAT